MVSRWTTSACRWPRTISLIFWNAGGTAIIHLQADGKRLEDLKRQLTPLNEERLRLEEELNRLTFEQAISSTDDGPAEAALQGCQDQTGGP